MASSMVSFIQYIEENYASRPAFLFYEGQDRVRRQVSFGQFAAHVRRFASALQGEYPDIRQKHIGLLSRNSYSYAAALFGVMLAGAVPVPLNAEESRQVLEEQIAFADISCLFVGEEYGQEQPWLRERYSPLLHVMEDYGAAAELVGAWDEPEEDTLAMLMFTSGTTSTGKCVMLTQKNVFSHIQALMPDKTVNNCFLCVPMYHISGIDCLLGWLLWGRTVVIGSSPKYIRQEMTDFACEHSFMVPATVESLCRSALRGKAPLPPRWRTVIVAGAKADPELMRKYEQFHVRVFCGYGMTETMGRITKELSADGKKGHSVGAAAPDCRVEIRDGEVCVASDKVMLGYYKNPEATAEVLRDGWLHTGDLGYFDEDGYLYLTGRKKNLIILSGGENVSPEELEGLLLRSPLVTEAVVREKEQRICAEIYCAPEDREAVQSVVEEANRQLAYYKHISLVEFRAEPFPRTASGKIRRNTDNER